MNALSIEKPSLDIEYAILEGVYESSGRQPPPRQRDLAHIAGASLGMTNSILKRLAQKGWIAVKKLNSRNIQYAVTLEGINEIVRRSYRHFRRTIRTAVYFKETLEDLARQAKSMNIDTVQLVGASELDFIVEHACRRWGLNFIKIPEIEKNKAASRDAEPAVPGAERTAAPAEKRRPERPAAASNVLKIYAEGIPEKPDGGRRNCGRSFYLSRLAIRQAAVAAPAAAMQGSAESRIQL